MIGALRRRVVKAFEVARFERRADRQREAERFVAELMARTPELRQPGRLCVNERQVWSQNGEDGVIEEIFERIGSGDRTFVEFGCGNGVENNSIHLLHQGWTGLWIDADHALIERIRAGHAAFIDDGSLRLVESAVTVDNVERLFTEGGVPIEVDMLSIDIDGNDYWVWEAIGDWRPRVAVVEYNAMWPPKVDWVQSYDPYGGWDGTSHHGAGLRSLESLGRRKGYSLVHCDLAGVNSFFVRDDLLGDHFPGPLNAERMWQPARYFLSVPPARKRGIGRFETVT